MKYLLTTGVLVRGRDDGPATWAMGSLFGRVASSQETVGAFGLSLVTQPPGTATPLHVHTQEAEAFYVLEGTMAYRAGEESRSVPAEISVASGEIGAELVEQSLAAFFAALHTVQAVEVDGLLGVGEPGLVAVGFQGDRGE